MNILRVLKIVHDRKNRALFDVLAEFFRLIGVFIVEIVWDSSGNQYLQADDSQFLLWLEKKPNSYLDNKPYFQLDVNTYPFIDQIRLNKKSLKENQTQLRNLFRDIFLEMEINKIVIDKDFLNSILDVYLNRAVVIAACNLQYYRMISPIHEQTKTIFLDTVSDLQCMQTKMIDQSKNMLSYRYAILYCMQKVNLACWFLENGKFNQRRGNGELCDENGVLRRIELTYNVSFLVKQCTDLIDQFPKEPNLYVLLGMITERSYDGYEFTVKAYNHALEMIGNQPYASNVFYWLGWVHGKKIPQDDVERRNLYFLEKQAYAKAYQCQKKYRNIYKVAVLYEKENNFERFRQHLLECRENLKFAAGEYMDPLEIEYNVKVLLLLCLRSISYFGDPGAAICYGKEALNFLKQHIMEDVFNDFSHLYGDDAEMYRQISLSRINVEKLQTSIYEAEEMISK